MESETEILADKVVALAGRPYLKARDVWDLNWLLQKGVQVNVSMVAEKVERYGLGSLPVGNRNCVMGWSGKFPAEMDPGSRTG